jgi:hypothetical protein
MNEQILTTIVGNDEAKTLLLTEPFYGAFCHVLFSLGRLGLKPYVPSTFDQGVNFEGGKHTPLRLYTLQ